MKVLLATLFLFFFFLQSSQAEKPHLFKLEATALGYAARGAATRGYESRYHLGVEHRSKKDAFLQHQFSLDLWGSLPQEISDWFDIPEAFLGVNLSNATLKIGRILPEWAKNEGPVRNLFPKFIIDPLTETQDGWVGISTGYQKPLSQNLSWGIEVLYSPLFIPNRGGITFPKDSQKNPRWLPPLYEEVNIGDGTIPLRYALHLPPIQEILLKQGGLLRISLNAKWFDIALWGSRFFKPEATLIHDAKLYIRNETSLEGRVHLYPEFPEERAAGVRSKLKWGTVALFHETAYFEQEASFENMAGFRFNTKRRWFPSFSAAVRFALDSRFRGNDKKSGNSESENSESHPSSPLPRRPEKIWISKALFRPFEISQLFLSYETDLSMTQRILKCGLDVGPLFRMKFGIGFDILSGDDQTYWGMFRANDRLWVKASYVF